MLIPVIRTRDLVRRLEKTSQAEREAYVEMHKKLFPDRLATSLSVGGAFAVVCGSHAVSDEIGHRAFSRCIGLGFDEPVTESMLDEIEAFYGKHQIPARIDLNPHADRTLIELLKTRGYRVESFMNTWIREPIAVQVDLSDGVDVREVGEEQRAAWRDTMGRGFANDDNAGFDPIAHTVSHLGGKFLFLATVDGVTAGAAAANISDSLGLINGAAVRPSCRRRGAQRALLAARINRLAGQCERMATITSPGSDSERNIERFGFQLLHTKPIMIQPMRAS